MSELKFKFKMPDDETLAKYISIKGEKGEKGDPTKLSQLENDTGFVSADTDALTNYYTKAQTDSAIDADVEALETELGVPDGFFTDTSQTVSGEGQTITLNGTANAIFKDIKLYGDTEQEGTPTPDNPVEVQVVTGDQTIIINDGEQQAQTFILSLGDLKLCGFGDYRDYIHRAAGGWYLHKSINRIALDVNSAHNINVAATNTARLTFLGGVVSAIPITLGYNSPTIGASNISVGAGSNNWASDAVGFRYEANGNVWWRLSKTLVGTTNEEVEDWLESQSIVVYYPLASPVETLITDDTLITQLEALWKAKSYNNTTIITVDGSLASLMNVSAYKSNWNGTISGINSALETKADKDVVALKPFYFNSVAEMQAYDLKVGDTVITGGFYENGDSGGARYKIRAADSSPAADGTTLIALNDNSLLAELVIDERMNVKQFGAKGDNVKDDTAAIQKAFDTCKYVEFKNATYKVVCISFKNNQVVEGNGSTLNCDLNTSAVIGFASHLTIRNLEIHSNNNDREWNRLDLRNNAYIAFEGCTFSGFQQQEVSPGYVGLNVWALYIRECHDIRVINCNFVDNNFQDVLIEFDNYNIYFENCNGSYNGEDGFIVDIEPSQIDKPNENFKFVNCVFRQFLTYEYYNRYNSNKNITVDSCIINGFIFKGGDLTIINSPIRSFRDGQALDFLNGDGCLKLENSIAISDNLLKDPYIKDLGYNTTTNWVITYSNTAWKNVAERVEDAEGQYLSLNNSKSSNRSINIMSKEITASEGDVFLIKQLCRAYYPTTGAIGSTAHHTRVLFYNSSDTLLSTLKLCNNRGEEDTEQEFSERSNIIMCPENTAYFKIMIRNGDADTSFRVDYASIGIYKLTCSEYKNNIAPLDFGTNKPFIVSQNPATSASNKINHFTGERCYYEAPSTFIGAVCSDGTNATWKEFGAIEP